MAKRYSGKVEIDIRYYDDNTYKGRVVIRDKGQIEVSQGFRDLRAPAIGLKVPYDSAAAYDEMARAALSFAAYDVNDFAENAEYDEKGEYVVYRKPRE